MRDEGTYLYHLNRGLRNALVDLMIGMLSPEDQRGLLTSAEAGFTETLQRLNPDVSGALSEADAALEYAEGVKLIMEWFTG